MLVEDVGATGTDAPEVVAVGLVAGAVEGDDADGAGAVAVVAGGAVDVDGAGTAGADVGASAVVLVAVGVDGSLGRGGSVASGVLLEVEGAG